MTTETVSASSRPAFSVDQTFDSSPQGTSEAFSRIDPVSLLAIRDVPTGWLPTVQQKLQQFVTLPENWDSYGAKPANMDSLQSALQLWFNLSQFVGVELPDVGLSPAGNASMSWEWDDGERNLDVEVLSNGLIRYVFLDGDSDLEGDTLSPEKIAGLLTRWSSR